MCKPGIMSSPTLWCKNSPFDTCNTPVVIKLRNSSNIIQPPFAFFIIYCVGSFNNSVVDIDLYAVAFSTAKNCGALAVPLNGSIAGRETTFPNTVTFSCDEGFLLNGSTVRRCQADGSWSGADTSCEGKIREHGFLSKISLHGQR